MPKRFTFRQLYTRVRRRAGSRGKRYKDSRVKELLRRGKQHCAKKVGEEGVEAALAAANESKHRLIAELADLEFAMAVVMVARGVTPNDVALELGKRTNGYEQRKRNGKVR